MVSTYYPDNTPPTQSDQEGILIYPVAWARREVETLPPQEWASPPPPPLPKPPELPAEHRYAMREALCVRLGEAYFKARPTMDTPANWRLFEAGCNRMYDELKGGQ
jgi:hypothetical protein